MCEWAFPTSPSSLLEVRPSESDDMRDDDKRMGNMNDGVRVVATLSAGEPPRRRAARPVTRGHVVVSKTVMEQKSCVEGRNQ